MSKTSYSWSSDGSYMSGPPSPRPIDHGRLYVDSDGSLRVEPDDDYYCGEMSAELSKQLAIEILRKQGWHLTVGLVQYPPWQDNE